MELLQLRYFAEVARLGSYTRAAESLHVSQPSLSQAVHRLEKEIGAPLFRKDGRRIQLTEQGRSFFARIAPAVQALDRAAEEAGGRRETLHGNIGIGTHLSVAPLLGCLRAFAEENPEVTFTFRQVFSRRREEFNGLDALLCYDYTGIPGFADPLPVATTAGRFVLPAGHPEPKDGERFTPEDLKDDYFVSLIWEDEALEEFFDEFQHMGISAKARYRTNSSLIKEELLEAGLAAGISNTALLSGYHDTGLYTLHPRSASETTEILLAWRRSSALSPAVQAFRQFTQDWFSP